MALDKVNETILKELGEQSTQQIRAVGLANAAYSKAVQELPAGDPSIEAAADTVKAERLALIDITEQRNKLIRAKYNIG